MSIAFSLIASRKNIFKSGIFEEIIGYVSVTWCMTHPLFLSPQTKFWGQDMRWIGVEGVQHTLYVYQGNKGYIIPWDINSAFLQF